MVVVSGPSGVGKGCICKELLKLDSNTALSISATTRLPRAGEQDGISYYFLSKDEFINKRDQGEFLEWAEVFGNYYGTLKSEVDRQCFSGKNIILEIDTQGAMQIKAVCPNSVYIFILPPSIGELEKRIRLRGSETEESLSLRLSKAESEMSLADQYDYCIVNKDVELAAREMYDIINVARWEYNASLEQGDILDK